LCFNQFALKKESYTSFFVLFIIILQIWKNNNKRYSLFLPLHFFTFYFFVNTEVGFKFRRLSFIGCYDWHVAQEFCVYRNLNTHLYQNNINLKIDISYSRPSLYISILERNDRTDFISIILIWSWYTSIKICYSKRVGLNALHICLILNIFLIVKYEQKILTIFHF